MRPRICLGSLGMAMALVLASTGASGPIATPVPRGSTVLEVFTAQGCINCPPADRAMSELAAIAGDLDAGLVPLEFHTPFFDGGPWPDPHAAYSWGRRARDYAARLGPEQLFVPWMVLNGRQQGAAHTSLVSLRAELDAHRLPEVAELSVSGTFLPGGRRLRVLLTARLLEEIDAAQPTVFMALYQRQVRTSIQKGDNAGLDHRNGWVVRLYSGGIFLDPKPAPARSVTLEVPLRDDWDPATMGLAVVLQDGTSGRIYQGRQGILDHGGASSPELNTPED